MPDIKIIVSATGAPIPVSDCDWSACIDGEEETTSVTGSSPAQVVRQIADILEAREIDLDFDDPATDGLTAEDYKYDDRKPGEL